MKIMFFVLVSSTLIVFNCTEKGNIDRNGEFFGEKPPSKEAEIFAPGIISTDLNVRDFALSPEGNEIFYTIRAVNGLTLMTVKRIQGKWTSPEVASFAGQYSDLEPCFSYEGEKLFFVSSRPLEAEGEEKDYDIWYVEKEGDEWGRPQNIGAPVSTEANEFYPSVTESGTIYYCMQSNNSIGGEDLFYAEFKDGKYQSPVNLGENVNTKADEYNSFISRNGSYIIFTSHGWGKGVGSGDLWISFKDENGDFQKPLNMGEKINSKYFEYCPSVTHDGKYLFFTSNKRPDSFGKNKLSYNDIVGLMGEPLNGSSNIYWISASLIDELRVN